MAYPLHIVDVFASQKYAGTQLAVVLNSDDLSQEQRLRIAQEMNYSETTFVQTARDLGGSYDVRVGGRVIPIVKGEML